MKASPRPGCRSSYQRAAASSSSSASGWLTTRMELGADVLNDLLHRAATDFAFVDFAGAPVNDFLPLGFGVSVHSVVEAGNELTGQVRPVLRRQGQHFGHFSRSNAHALTVSAFPVAQASFGLHREVSPSFTRMALAVR